MGNETQFFNPIFGIFRHRLFSVALCFLGSRPVEIFVKTRVS
jgi:hypothetical protein